MTRNVHWCVTVEYQQIANANIANQIHGFTVDCGKFILIQFIIKFSTSDNAILVFWLVHCISVTSHYTCVWPYMEINAANVKLFLRSQVLSTKKWMRKETNSVSFLQKKYKKLQTMPSQKQRKGHIVQNENIQRYVFVKFPVESCKISNMNIEILRLHEDYVTTTIFT